MFVDGHSSHINNYDFLKACLDSEKDIQVVCFPSGQTANLQPLDKSVFGSVKTHWRQHLQSLAQGMFADLPPLERNTFPAHLVRLFEQSKFQSLLPSGFRETGIFPFKPELILETVLPENPLPSRTAASDTDFASPKRHILTQLQRIPMTEASMSRIMAQVDVAASGL